MAKTIIKETLIMLLLCVAIILILGAIFYDSIPSNKVIPPQLEAYTTPEKVKTEIEENITQFEKAEVSYEITSSDLSLYKQSRSYTSGKVDPFASSAVVPSGTGNGSSGTDNTGTANTTINSTTNSENTPSANNTVDPNSTGTFFNNTGLK